MWCNRLPRAIDGKHGLDRPQAFPGRNTPNLRGMHPERIFYVSGAAPSPQAHIGMVANMREQKKQIRPSLSQSVSRQWQFIVVEEMSEANVPKARVDPIYSEKLSRVTTTVLKCQCWVCVKNRLGDHPSGADHAILPF